MQAWEVRSKSMTAFMGGIPHHNGYEQLLHTLDEEKNGYAARDQLLYAL